MRFRDDPGDLDNVFGVKVLLLVTPELSKIILLMGISRNFAKFNDLRKHCCRMKGFSQEDGVSVKLDKNSDLGHAHGVEVVLLVTLELGKITFPMGISRNFEKSEDSYFAILNLTLEIPDLKIDGFDMSNPS